LPLARLRASGRLLELGSDELALTRREATLLLRNVGVELPEAEITELVCRTEGWAAALYLAALSFRDHGRGNDKGHSQKTIAFTGDDRYLADYFCSEYLSHLSEARLEFLRRTSVLERMSGSLCDAVLERQGSARELASIERSNLFLVPLDRRREWFRYHHLFRDLLQRELVEREPELVPALHRRAADWFNAYGEPESALEHAEAAGDTERAAEILGSIALHVYYSGRIATLERWLDRYAEEGRLERFPAVALQGSGVHLLRGRLDEAERWLAAAERSKVRGPLPDGSRSMLPWISVLRAAMCTEGPEQMRADAVRALINLPATSPWRPSALLMQGIAEVLLGEDGQGEAILGEAAEAAEGIGSTEIRIIAISERSLLAEARGEHKTADSLALQAHALVEERQLEGYPTRAIELAASARVHLRHGRWGDARAHLTGAQRLTPLLVLALPWLAVQTRLALARTCVALRDADGARALLAEIDEIIHLRPRLGVLSAQAEWLKEQIGAIPRSADGRGRGLTAAELRLLPLLATHHSFREIGERLYISRNTVKTQAISVYRKLGVSSRSEAIERASQLGLLEHAAST
jgi:LuxR family maltose regulon positive regulatory protein